MKSILPILLLAPVLGLANSGPAIPLWPSIQPSPAIPLWPSQPGYPKGTIRADFVCVTMTLGSSLPDNPRSIIVTTIGTGFGFAFGGALSGPGDRNCLNISSGYPTNKNYYSALALSLKGVTSTICKMPKTNPYFTAPTDIKDKPTLYWDATYTQATKTLTCTFNHYSSNFNPPS